MSSSDCGISLFGEERENVLVQVCSADERRPLLSEERENTLAQVSSGDDRIPSVATERENAQWQCCHWQTYMVRCFLALPLVFYLVLALAGKFIGMGIDDVADAFLKMHMLTGIILQVVCLCQMSKPKFVQFGKLGHEHSTTHLMIGIYVFGVGTLFAILFRLLAYYRDPSPVMSCDFQNRSQTNVQAGIQNGTSSNSTHAKTLFDGVCYSPWDIAFDYARLIFTLLQLYFIQTFREARSTSSFLPAVTLGYTIVTDVDIWVRYALSEIHFLKHAGYHMVLDQFAVRTLQIEEILTPFILEYSLLAVGLLGMIYSQMETVGRTRSGFESNPREVQFSCSSTREMTNIDTENDIPMDANSISTREEYLPIDSYDDQKYQVASRVWPGLISGTFCGLLLLVSSLMLDSKLDALNRRPQNFFLCYEGTLALLQAIAIGVVLKKLKYKIKCEWKVNAQIFLIVVGFLGTFVFNVITVVSVILALIHSSENEDTAILSLWQLFMLLLSQTLQFTLLILVNSHCCSLTGYQTSTAQRIRSLTVFLLTTNIGFWALDSFIEIKDNAISAYPSGKKIFGHTWNYITSLCYPFAIFYRFHSAEKLYEFWSQI